MQRQKIGTVMLYLPPRLLVILEELKRQLGISRNAIVRALLSYMLEHPEIINEVFPLEKEYNPDDEK
jgi:hypothetical protein